MGIYITGPGLGGVIAASTTNSVLLPFLMRTGGWLCVPMVSLLFFPV